jgi:thymidylate synthase ThyX
MKSFVIETSYPNLSIVGLENESNQRVQRFFTPKNENEGLTGEDFCFVAARYSRSDKNVLGIIDEIVDKSVSMSERASKIAIDYGHSSVAEFAQVGISFEGVSELLAMFMLNKINTYGASQRSTRYQKMDTEGLIGTKSDTDFYREVLERAKPYGKDAYDSIRYLLLMGTRTSLWISTNLREWAMLISLLKGYDELEEFVSIGNLIEELLTKEIEGVSPPGANLVRHTEPHDYKKDVAFTEELSKRYRLDDHNRDGLLELVQSYYPHHYDVVPGIIELYANPLSTNYMATILDLGQIRDWNRHRSLLRYIPFIEYGCNKEQLFELGIDIGISVVNDKVDTKFNNYIEEVLAHVYSFVNPSNLYSYPMGFHTPIYISGPISKQYYTYKLRSNDGGHTAYRQQAAKFLATLFA